ncbi:restriction endonuclease subunit S [Acinetobacter sp. ANC 4173]|uniref:restriction endonuclease subunit S n=1 Tax=Acinetobacter sp. ANC 4173 TaxID=2529837 RepID=UPI0013F16123|nr:restriction endonuclease subunit S [Acinetobacter sp. ANC 4173]
MKTLVIEKEKLLAAKRWDIDFHLPAEGIQKYPPTLLKKVKDVAQIRKEKRDPRLEPEEAFKYIDISCIDVQTGLVNNHQDLLGEEAPSRARKVVSAYDILISTCRPTRGAIAVVPIGFHNEVASTGFSVLKAKDGVNPFYLFFALRLDSTLEQFRKFSTGSSYPAILDEDVLNTFIPVPSLDEQNRIAKEVFLQIKKREDMINAANRLLKEQFNAIEGFLSGDKSVEFSEEASEYEESFIYDHIQSLKSELSILKTTQTIKENAS